MRTPVVLSILCATSASFALPNPDTRFRPGANHHVGDDSFVEAFHRAPTDADGEKQRMKTHLVHVRAQLAARPATTPALEKRRAEILGYLDDYIAKGITPQNEHLPWRAPVFIDDHGAICAVGYLIERSVGRALPERIAREHRYEFLEDIAAAMPDVRTWVTASGFTLDELASIQPAYSSPNIQQWRTWDLVRHAAKDGAYDDKRVAGMFVQKTLHGTWTVKNDDGTVVGTGTLARGNGGWKSYYRDGKTLLATGPYRNSKANGAWTFYHPSGNVAAKGTLLNGTRNGAWTFYYDTKTSTPIATGPFLSTGAVTGVWRHYDAAGKLLARTYGEAGDMIDVTADASGVVERTHAFMDPPGPIEGRAQRLSRFALGNERVFIHDSGFSDLDVVFDPAGFKLERTATGGWTAADCGWSAKRKQIAKSDNVAWLHKMLFTDSHTRSAKKGEYGIELTAETGPVCGKPQPVAADRAKRLDSLIASRLAVRAPNPDFIRAIILNEESDKHLTPAASGGQDIVADDSGTKTEPDDDNETYRLDAAGKPVIDAGAWKRDLRAFITTHAIDYVEWPHIDGRFDRVFRTMAGHYRWEWHSSEAEADGTDPLKNNPRRR